MTANRQVLGSLDNAVRAGRVPARLDTPKGPLSFLFNPESKRYSLGAEYAQAGAVGTAIKDLNYVGSSGRSLELSDLLLDSHVAGKSLGKLLEGLQALTKPQGQGLAPPVVSFVWGSDIFGPAVITSLDWTESGWLSGEPALARLSMTLEEVPVDETTAAAPIAPTGAVSLTDRQKEEATAQASGWLADNAARLKPLVRNAIASSTVAFAPADDGGIGLLDGKGALLGSAGFWDGFTFVPSEDLIA